MTDSNTFPPPQAPAPVKKSHKKLWIVLGVLGGLFVIGSVMPKSDTSSTGSTSSDTSSSDTGSSSGVDSTNSGNHAAADDVELSTCSSGTYLPSVSVEITNHTSKRSNYLVEVSLLDSYGNKVGDGNALSNNVEPDQSATEDVLATVAEGKTLARCKIVSVTRYAS